MDFSERKYSIEYALSLAQQYADDKEWSFDVTSLGSSGTTKKCIIKNKSDEILSVGYGKGLDIISTAGCIYEAIEHYYSSYELTQGEINFVRSSQLLSEETIKNSSYYNEITRQNECDIGCFSYKNVFSGKSHLVPAFLSFVDYVESPPIQDSMDYSKLLKFSTNSGISISSSFEEACIHGICEIVERDALSIFFAKHFLGKNILEEEFLCIPCLMN